MSPVKSLCKLPVSDYYGNTIAEYDVVGMFLIANEDTLQTPRN